MASFLGNSSNSFHCTVSSLLCARFWLSNYSLKITYDFILQFSSIKLKVIGAACIFFSGYSTLNINSIEICA